MRTWKTKLTQARFGGAALILFFAAIQPAIFLHASNIADQERQSVEGLTARADHNNTILAWPSLPQESFAVLWRSNTEIKTPWINLTGYLEASKKNETVFCDTNGLLRSPELGARSSGLADFYRVLVIPDFWENVTGVVFDGGPQNPGQDFLPFYYGTEKTDVLKPQVQLFVDGEDDPEDSGDCEILSVNVGSAKKPHWVYAAGFWLAHDRFANGEHTLQLHSLCPLNYLVEDGQNVTVTNKPVRITIRNSTTGSNNASETLAPKSQAHSWWITRLGKQFVRSEVSPEEATRRAIQLHDPLESKLCPRPLDLSAPNSNAPSAMVMQFDAENPVIQVTPSYSNAVLEAVLPLFSDTARKLDLPLPHPIMRTDLDQVGIPPLRSLKISVRLKNGWIFNFAEGYVRAFVSPDSYYRLQNPADIPQFYGKVKIKEVDAVRNARDALKRLGIPLEAVFAERAPMITPPVVIGTNTVPRFRVKWLDPRGGHPVADLEVNAENGKIERMFLALTKNLERPTPQLKVAPPLLDTRTMFSANIPPPVNPEYAWKLIPVMLNAIDKYAAKLSLPVAHPLTTNNVARVELNNNGGWPHCEVELTNGWRFIYRHSMVNGYYAPDNFCSSDRRPIRIKEFTGKWNMNETEAIALVKKTIAKLGYSTNHVHLDFAPHVIYPSGDFKKIIPRYFFEWFYENAAQDDLESKVEAEVDSDRGELKSLYYDDKAYWNERPPIDVPISSR